MDIRTVIDVGANTGQFAREAVKRFPRAELFCFEPLVGAFEELQRWASSVDHRVTVFNYAVGETEGSTVFHQHSAHSTSSSLLETTTLNTQYYPFMQKQQEVLVKVEALDTALAKHRSQMERAVLLKLDVQGFEDRVLRGAKETLGYATACLLEIDLDLLYKGQASFGDLTHILYAAGYRYAGNLDQIYADDGHVIFGDALFVKNK